MEKKEIVDLIQALLDFDPPDEREQDRLLEQLEELAGTNEISDAIFWPKEDDPTAEEIYSAFFGPAALRRKG